MKLRTEPVRLLGALTAVAISTVGVLVKTGAISADLAAEFTVWIGAVSFAAAELVRSHVTPTSQVALTNEQAEALAPPIADA